MNRKQIFTSILFIFIVKTGSLATQQINVSPTWIDFCGKVTSSNGVKLLEGTVIQALDPSGEVCGEFVVKKAGQYGYMPVYGDDPHTLNLDEGAVEGELITFTVNGVQAVVGSGETPRFTTSTLTQRVDLLQEIVIANLSFTIEGSMNPGDEFWVAVRANDVANLFGIAFEMTYWPTTFISALNFEVGDLLGSDLVSFSNIDTTAGKVNIGISQKAGLGGAYGSGNVARIRMKMSAETPLGEMINLNLQNVVANDPSGNAIDLVVLTQSITTPVKGGKATQTPQEFALMQNHPNPFNPSTIIEYSLPQKGSARNVKLQIYNTIGENIRTLIDEPQRPGFYAIQWDGRDDNGLPVSGGLYFYTLRAGFYVAVNKMLLIR